LSSTLPDPRLPTRASTDRAGLRRQFGRDRVRISDEGGDILFRFFIPGASAAGGYLAGDDRGYSSDPDARFRIAVAWNTDTGEVTYTVVQSCSPGWEHCHAQDAIRSGGANDLALSNRPGRDNQNTVTLQGTYSGLNSKLPCCSVNGVVGAQLFGANPTCKGACSPKYQPGSIHVFLAGDKYPAFEAYKYEKNGTVHNLARSDPSRLDGLSAFPAISQRSEDWFYVPGSGIVEHDADR
jgi:hypothetical protein